MPVRAPDRFSDLAQPDLWSLRNHRDIPYTHRSSVLSFQDRGADVVRISHQANGANVVRLLAAFNEAAACIHVVGGERLLYLRDAQTVGDQLVRIHLRLVFAGQPAKAHHVRNVRHRLQLFFEEPILYGFQFHQIVIRVGTHQAVEINLTHRAVVRSQNGIQILRQADLRQFLQSLLARKLRVGAVFEDHGHHRQPKQRNRTQISEMGHTIHLSFDWDGDLLLYFFGSAPRPLRHDLHPGVGDVGIGFYRQRVERVHTPRQQHNSER